MSDYQNFDKKRDRVEALWPTLSTMTPDQLRDHIRKIRADRRVRKTVSKEKKSKVSKAETANTKIKKLVGADSAMLAKLLKELGNGDGS